MTTKLSHINSYDTDDPKKLSRQLSDLEDRVDSALQAVQRDTIPLPDIAVFLASTARGIVAVQPDQQLAIDTSQANAAAVFPLLTPSNFGRRFIIIKRSTANTIVTSCQDAAVLCNGAAFPTLGVGAIGRYEFTCDASGYYR